MFVSIGNCSLSGAPIMYDQTALSREAIFNLLTMKVTSQLPAVTGEEYRQLDEHHTQLVGQLEAEHNELAAAALNVYDEFQEWTYTALFQAYEQGFSDAMECEASIGQMQREQSEFLIEHNSQSTAAIQDDVMLQTLCKMVADQAQRRGISFEEVVTGFIEDSGCLYN